MSQKRLEKVPNSSKEIIQQLGKLIKHRKPLNKKRLCGKYKIFMVPSQESWLATIGYILGDIIAVGRCGGVVHRADDILGNGRVAVKIIKLIHLHRWGMSREYIKLNIRNYWLKLSHPHICHLHDVIIGRKKAFFITQFACQGDVQQYIQNEEKYKLVFPKTVRRWCWQITSALKYLHNQRLAHSNLKLENVLLNCKLNVKLTDIGFAWNVFHKKSSDFRSPINCTKAYSAPEVLMRDAMICDISADLWSLGVVIYALWNRCLPFPGHAERSVIVGIQKKDIPWKRGNKHPVDRLASDLVCKLLQILPGKRLSCNEVMNHQLFSHNLK